MVYLSFVEIFREGRFRGLLADDRQEKCTPANHNLLFAEGCGEVEL
jgi:hypothetical protein